MSAEEIAKRDHLAELALIAQLRHPNLRMEGLNETAHLFARDSYAIADAMLTERAKVRS